MVAIWVVRREVVEVVVRNELMAMAMAVAVVKPVVQIE